MSADQELVSHLRRLRHGAGWSQEELAARSGVSRAGISAIEMGRVAPSTAAALALSRALSCSVEELFQLATPPPATKPAWAWRDDEQTTRYWEASVGSQRLRFPTEPTAAGTLPHDGIVRQGRNRTHDPSAADSTLVIAGCDPAVGILVQEAAKLEGLRVIPLARSSRASLELLRQGLVHAAGIHLASPDTGLDNAEVAGEALGDGYELLRIAQWEQGIAVARDQSVKTVPTALRSKMRWIGREPGSGARQFMDEIFGDRPRPRRTVSHHRGVCDAIRWGFADAGVCLRLVTKEAGLDFLPIRSEPYDLCFPANHDDERVRALQRVIRSSSYRQLLRDLPGYDGRKTGEASSTH